MTDLLNNIETVISTRIISAISFYRIFLLFTYQKGDDPAYTILYSGDIQITSQKEYPSERKKMMHPAIVYEYPKLVDVMNSLTTILPAVEIQPNPKVEELLSDLSPDTPWGDRQIAAKKLGYLRSREALPGLLGALPVDPFWMVRCAIIQALEMIGDPGAIPTLREVAICDGFQVVRSYAAKAIERLSNYE
jgi:hypothetical protein